MFACRGGFHFKFDGRNSRGWENKRRKVDKLISGNKLIDRLCNIMICSGIHLPAPVAVASAVGFVGFAVAAVASLAIRFLDYHEYHHLNSPLHWAPSHSMTNYCSNFASYSTLACYSNAYHFAYESTNCLSLSSNNYRYHSDTVCSRKYKIRRVLTVDVAGLNRTKHTHTQSK